ncbi:MAG: NAD-dependent succinate-semialdehyde dehydrogenase [Planctomycetes bacterium]|nr:NAD-dependent succinate-semialdehyde dehydrogenase [Planctomycetota bacterium]
MESINPATEERIATYPEMDAAEVRRRIERAAAGFELWRTTPVEERVVPMRKLAELLRARRDGLGRLMTLEMGKPIVSAEAEVEKCAWVCDFYAEHAAEFLAPRQVASGAAASYVRYDPLGVILAVMPWNFPFWQVFRFLAPALMAGNAAVLKHASNVCGCALAIEELVGAAGFPDGLMATLLIPSGRVAEVVQHPAVRAATLTGSEQAGMAIAAAAGRELKKTVLELGGSDPFIVLADADVAAVAAAAAAARTINCGQSCIAAKRFIVEEPIAEAFTEALVASMQRLKVGDPLDRGNDLGPLARRDLVDELHRQVTQSVAAGAKLLCGGEPTQRVGYYYPPTVLANVLPGMAAFDEETFGPVAPVIRARDADEAIALANQSNYGLGASIWTADPARAERLAAELQAGCVFINEAVKSDPRLPFGGVKRSGYGRELADVGMLEFVNIKTVWRK